MVAFFFVTKQTKCSAGKLICLEEPNNSKSHVGFVLDQLPDVADSIYKIALFSTNLRLNSRRLNTVFNNFNFKEIVYRAIEVRFS